MDFKPHAKKENPSQLDLRSIDRLHGGLASNYPSSDSFNFETDFDPSSFIDHILATSEDLSVMYSEDFEEDTSIVIPKERSSSEISWGGVNSRKCLWDSSLETVFYNFNEDFNE